MKRRKRNNLCGRDNCQIYLTLTIYSPLKEIFFGWIVAIFNANFEHASRIGRHACYPNMQLGPRLLAKFNEKVRVGGKEPGRVGKPETQVFFFGPSTVYIYIYFSMISQSQLGSRKLTKIINSWSAVFIYILSVCHLSVLWIII